MMNGDSGGWHCGFGFGHWGLGILFWVVIILVIAVLFRALMNTGEMCRNHSDACLCCESSGIS